MSFCAPTRPIAELQTIAGFFAEMARRGRAVLVRAAGPFGPRRAGARNGRRRDDDVFPLWRSHRRLRRAGRGDVGRLGRLSQRRRAGPRLERLGGYSPAIAFTTAPAAGVAITADFGVLWLCRFADDVADLENFMTLLFELRTSN